MAFSVSDGSLVDMGFLTNVHPRGCVTGPNARMAGRCAGCGVCPVARRPPAQGRPFWAIGCREIAAAGSGGQPSWTTRLPGRPTCCLPVPQRLTFGGRPARAWGTPRSARSIRSGLACVTTSRCAKLPPKPTTRGFSAGRSDSLPSGLWRKSRMCASNAVICDKSHGLYRSGHDD